LPREEAEALLVAREGSLCVRLYRRQDGTVLTSDCPVGVKKRRRRRAAVAAVGGGLMAAAAALGVERGAQVRGVATMGDPAPLTLVQGSPPVSTAESMQGQPPAPLMGKPVPPRTAPVTTGQVMGRGL